MGEPLFVVLLLQQVPRHTTELRTARPARGTVLISPDLHHCNSPLRLDVVEP
jgi:hypothetical protein